MLRNVENDGDELPPAPSTICATVNEFMLLHVSPTASLFGSAFSTAPSNIATRDEALCWLQLVRLGHAIVWNLFSAGCCDWDWFGIGWRANNDGQQQHQNRNYQAAFESFRVGCTWGNKVAYRNMGYLHENGHYVATNIVIAAKFYRISFEKGYREAQRDINRLLENTNDPVTLISVGTMYYNSNNSEGVARNYLKAFVWFNKAKQRGSANACRNIGLLFENGGYGINRNLAEAERYFRESLQMGYPRQQFEADMERLRQACRPSSDTSTFSYSNGNANTLLFNQPRDNNKQEILCQIML